MLSYNNGEKSVKTGTEQRRDHHSTSRKQWRSDNRSFGIYVEARVFVNCHHYYAFPGLPDIHLREKATEVAKEDQKSRGEKFGEVGRLSSERVKCGSANRKV